MSVTFIRPSVRPLLFSGLFFCLPLLLPAQDSSTKPQPATTTLSVDARLVNLPVVVRDKKGALVQNLTKDDFVLRVDNNPQTIRYFDHDANLPLILGLLVDTSQSQRSVLDDERTSSSAFLDEMLTSPGDRDPDKAFVIQFARTVELLQDLTLSRPKLQAALKEVDTPSSNTDTSNSSDDSDHRSRGRGSHGGTALYDATFLASDELMHKQKGRKALILLTDGVDSGSKETLTQAIEAAQRADTILYAIYFKGEEPQHDQGQRGGGGSRFPGGGFPGGGGRFPGSGGGGGNNGGGQRGPATARVDGKKILQRMADETGGRLFEVSKKQTTAQIYTQIAEELRAQYRLGYTPDQATAADGYHQIDLTLRQPDQQKKLTVQTRDGYYSGK
ncbi:VWA domain-containing protein [Granulicella sp. dw_53]|uniref:VWA domain-containing protein n=1 Tax=Granulicella sp. dw_53 TaxID=2719792 RepID=UPI001BD4A933|nr:VWA domain-containing protein [Granulicella sp. dw_53]